MTHVRRPRLRNRVEVQINHPIQIPDRHGHDLAQRVKLKGLVGHKGRKGNRCQITNSRLLFVRILYDFCTVARQNAIKDARMILRLVEAEGIGHPSLIRHGQDRDRMADPLAVDPFRKTHPLL